MQTRVDLGYAVVIPTYRRAASLAALLGDLARQTWRAERVVVVDGDADSGAVKAALHQSGQKVSYIPSNHANAPYQRCLGARACQEMPLIVFCDDDMRLEQVDLMEELLAPFGWAEKKVVGVSPRLVFPNAAGRPRRRTRKKPPGGLTPSGDRIPVVEEGNYARAEWLHGGVMAYRTPELLVEIFSPDAFAMSERGYGLGVDDTFLSRAVGSRGELWLALCAEALHPGDQPSQVQPDRAEKKGFATAYSRRFLNDRYRYPHPPHLGDRLYLLKTYLGNCLIHWARAIRSRREEARQYAAGYTRGVLKGLLAAPRAEWLAPGVDWERDLAAALSLEETIDG